MVLSLVISHKFGIILAVVFLVVHPENFET